MQTKDFNYRGAAFLGRQFIHPPFDRYDNKSYLSNPYSFQTQLTKSSRYDSLNNSHIITTAKEKRISPLRSGYIETETPRDILSNLSDRKSARLKTDESEKFHKLIDSSLDGTYIQKLKNSTDNRKKFPLTNNNTRASSNNRTGRYNVPTRDQPSPIRSTGESIVDTKGKNMHQYLKSKRPSAHVRKNLSYSYVDAGLPVIYAHGSTRVPREKVASTRVSSINSEMTEFQSLDTPNLALKIPKKNEMSRFSPAAGKALGIGANDKAFKFRMKPNEQQLLLPQKYTTDMTDIAEACYLSTSSIVSIKWFNVYVDLGNSESFMGEYIPSSARDNSKESHEHTPQVLRVYFIL